MLLTPLTWNIDCDFIQFYYSLNKDVNLNSVRMTSVVKYLTRNDHHYKSILHFTMIV